MDYKAKVPKTNHNVSPKQPLKEMLTLLVGTVSFLLIIYVVLGFLVDATVDAISPETEISIYRAFGRATSQSIIDDGKKSETEKQTQQLFSELSRCIDIGYPISVEVKESDRVNAFASPAGHIVIFSGLLDKVQSENGLAFVLAHELAHFKNRDHLRALGRVIIIIAISALIGGDTDISNLLSPITSLEAAQYSQERESLADAVALDIINCHYGHIGGATEFFEVIAGPEENTDFTLTHYFSSHPEAQRRIKNIQCLGKENGYEVRETTDNDY